MAKHALTTAAELASLLAGSWRPGSPKDSNRFLEGLAPLLSKGGAAALAWFSIRHKRSELSESIATFYYKAYVGSAARAAVHETELERLLQAFNACDIRCILLKGWSVGRLYPESGLRPYGDIDLWIDPDRRKIANTILRELHMEQNVDLEHDQLNRFKERCFEEFYASGEMTSLGVTSTKIPRREDQVRILCLHFLKHGGWRPIWLCDIAVVLESSTAAFNWELCLGSDARRARWIGCTIALARDLLAASIPPGASGCVTSSPPGWFTRTILQEWSNPSAPSAPSFFHLIPELKSRPWKLKLAVRDRWRNPIQATVDCNCAFDALPRWPYQLWNGISRAHRLLSGSKQNV